VQGEVTEVLKRRQLEFPGKLQLSENFAFFVADEHPNTNKARHTHNNTFLICFCIFVIFNDLK